MPVSFTKDEAYAFLNSRPGRLIVTTIGRNGFPHSVPVGYFLLGEDIYVGGRANTQRIKNAQRNPQVSAMVEAGSSLRELKGVLAQGEAEVITEPEEVLPLLREGARQRGTPEDQLPTEPRPNVAYIRIKPRRFISWDYSRDE